MKKWSLLLFICFPYLIQAQVVINEIQFKPTGGSNNDEFVEFFNTSFVDSIDIAGWTLRDNNTTTTLVYDHGHKKIPPRSYALLVDRDYVFGTGIYGSLPGTLTTFKTFGASIGNGLGNTVDSLYLFPIGSLDAVSSFAYTAIPAGHPEGISFEKVNPDLKPFDRRPSTNWVNSTTPNGTPGLQNSSFQLFSINGVNAKLLTPNGTLYTSDSLTIKMIVANGGSTPITTGTIKLSVDLDQNSMFTAEEILHELLLPTINSGDTLTVFKKIKLSSEGIYWIQTELVVSDDESSSDNILSKNLTLVEPVLADAAVTQLTVSPLTFEATTDSAIVSGKIKNISIQTADSIRLTVSLLTTSGVLTQTLLDQWIEQVSPDSEFLFSKKFSSTIHGNFIIKAKVFQRDDINHPNDSLQQAITITKYRNRQDIVLSEVMYNPQGAEGTFGTNEFVELFNRSLTDTINLSGYKLVDASGTQSGLVPRKESFLIPPQKFAVVHPPSYFTQVTPLYIDIEDTIQAIIFATSNNSIGNTLSTNDFVAILSDRADTVEKYRWTTDSGDGYSMEKYQLSIKNDQKNWAKSKTIHGSPGKLNTIRPKERDWKLTLRNIQAPTAKGGQFTANAVIVNTGTTPITATTLTYSIKGQTANDYPRKEVFYESVSQFGLNLNFLDSLLIPQSFNIPIAGKINLRLTLSSNLWPDTTVSVPMTVGFLPADLLVSEFLPRETSFTEYVEVYNNSTTDTLSLNGWTVQNNSSTKGTFTNVYAFIPPQKYFVFFRDSVNFYREFPSVTNAIRFSALPALKDAGDAIRLIGPANKLVDSLSYDASWVIEPNKSFERVSFSQPSTTMSNWKKSELLYGTAGSINSQFLYTINGALSGSSQHVAYPEQSIVMQIGITNRGSQILNNFSIAVYEDLDRNGIVTLADSLTSVLFTNANLAPDATLNVPINRTGYTEPLNWIIFLRLQNDGFLANNKITIPILIANSRNSVLMSEFMFDPLADPNDNIQDQTEFVELYNPGDSRIFLKNWVLTDQPNELGVANRFTIRDSVYIYPKSFHVIAADSNIFKFWTHLVGTDTNRTVSVIRVSNLSLNNTSDGILIYDAVGGLIDSLYYSSNWHNPNRASTRGVSLERRSYLASSVDPKNWSTSVNLPSGATPGQPNSILVELKPQSSAVTVTPNPFSPDGDGFDDVVKLSYAFTGDIQFVKVTIFDRMGREINRLQNYSASGNTGEIFWDGRKTDGTLASIGPYVFLVEALDVSGGAVKAEKVVVVLAKKL